MAEKQAVLVFSSYRRIDELTKEEILKPFIVPGKVTHRSLLRTCPIFPSTAVYDRTKIGKRYFNEKMGSLRDDYVYWLDMLRSDVVCAYGNPKVLVDYRLRKTSVTANKKKVIKPQWLVLRKIEELSFFKACYYLGCWAIISSSIADKTERESPASVLRPGVPEGQCRDGSVVSTGAMRCRKVARHLHRQARGRGGISFFRTQLRDEVQMVLPSLPAVALAEVLVLRVQVGKIYPSEYVPMSEAGQR